jgi:broad specificity phosphatase PhoE
VLNQTNVKKILLSLLVILCAASCTKTYYVVRHAEKDTAATGGQTTNATPLSAEGRARANALRDTLASKNIRYVFTTNTARTRSTGRPTALASGADTILYATPNNDSIAKFISRLKKLKKNTLIVGHSNTVDDITNLLSGAPSVAGDLTEPQFDNLFIIRYSTFIVTKKTFTRKKYGVLTPP